MLCIDDIIQNWIGNVFVNAVIEGSSQNIYAHFLTFVTSLCGVVPKPLGEGELGSYIHRCILILLILRIYFHLGDIIRVKLIHMKEICIECNVQNSTFL